ncbi:MAG: hypothetical protein HOH74_09730 [Gemmatimonadetes bacterium]|nr:hypothetical protein [Gemmatimonadota bacterium]
MAASEAEFDADMARAIWDFARAHRYHSTTADDEVKDTVKMLNVYGYTLCWDEAYTVSNLWQAAGLKIRRGLPHGHCTTEVFYDGDWHLLDSDEHLLVLGRDNETIVGEAEISHDHDLLKRSHTYGVLSPEDRTREEGAASLFCHAGGRGGTRPKIGDHRMDLVLRPGEALRWGWDHRGRYHGYGDPPPRFCNGDLTWCPPLDGSFASWTEAAQSAKSDGECLTADSVTWRLQAPYVMVGGRLHLALGDSPARVDLSRDAASWTAVADGASGTVVIDLDEHFPHDTPATYRIYLRLAGQGYSLRHLQIELTLQMAPLSLPSLQVGDNTVSYTDDSAHRKMEVTHTWRERHDLTAPDAPEPESPDPDGVVAGSTPTLRWSDTCGVDGDYHIRLGTDVSLRRVLSPVFDKLVSRTPSRGRPQWTVPEAGLLNPQTLYYWQVRARNGAGLWGAWSRTTRCTIQAPGVPLEVRFSMDWATRQGTLSWQANPVGTAPTHYEIYGSDERGFSISRQAYTIVSGASDAEGVRCMAANLLSETPQTEKTVVGSDLTDGNRAFYRVVAIDAAGIRSGPSAYVEAPRPFVFTPLPAQIPSGATTTLPLETIASIGDLRAESDGPHRYRMAIRDGDNVTFVLDEGPEFVELDAVRGVLTLRPEPRHASTHTITVRVKNGQGGVDVVGFDVLVTA